MCDDRVGVQMDNGDRHGNGQEAQYRYEHEIDTCQQT